MLNILNGADYAEYFEWLDGNIDEEDRRGYFVTLEDDKIKIAQPGDYILGAVSSMPSSIGIFYDNSKFFQFLRDKFGNEIEEEKEITYTVQEWDNEINEFVLVEKTEIAKVKIPNPNYIEGAMIDKDKSYAPIGLLGQLRIRDNGECQANGYCICGSDGIAIPSTEGYKVLQRLSNDVIRILFK